MCLKGTGKVYESENRGRMVYIPMRVGKDSKFPFGNNEEVDVKVSGERLIVSGNKEF